MVVVVGMGHDLCLGSGEVGRRCWCWELLLRCWVVVLQAAATVGRLVIWLLLLLLLLRSLCCRVSGAGLGITSGGIACCTRGVVFVLRGWGMPYADTKRCLAAEDGLGCGPVLCDDLWRCPELVLVLLALQRRMQVVLVRACKRGIRACRRLQVRKVRLGLR